VIAREENKRWIEIAIEALHIIAGSDGISRITAESALREIEELDE